MDGGPIVGIVANPASARDIRRLVAGGSIVTTSQKINIVKRVLSGLAAAGIEEVVSMTDLGGISAGLESLAETSNRTSKNWPRIEFVEHAITQSASDTAAAVDAMTGLAVDAIVVIGGDGTNRVVANGSGDIPLASISTGTNNAFPSQVEPTVVGLATGLVATGQVARTEATYRCKTLTVSTGEHRERALVDVAIVDNETVGSKAVWDPETISELFLCLAEPQAIGLSSIGAHLCPVGRHDRFGLHLRLGRPPTTRVRAPILPGVVVEVEVAECNRLHLEVPVEVGRAGAMVAIDGERTFRLAADDTTTVTLGQDGPVVIDVTRTMDVASRRGVLNSTPTTNESQSQGGSHARAQSS